MDYLVVCTNRPEITRGHRHIVSIGTGDEPGEARDRVWTVAQVYAGLDRGDLFVTKSPTTKHTARVEKIKCSCGESGLRSNPDQVTDNNLDDLPGCEVLRRAQCGTPAVGQTEAPFATTTPLLLLAKPDARR
jgi:hypothetical protein